MCQWNRRGVSKGAEDGAERPPCSLATLEMVVLKSQRKWAQFQPPCSSRLEVAASLKKDINKGIT
jgi:hypothetical protein